MLRAVIVEDEPTSRDRLRRLLGSHSSVVEVVGDADSGPSAVEQIESCQPDVVFLDVSLPGFGGFDVLRQLKTSVKVVFTTAHEEHAVRAFNERAVHYLLKPIDPAQLAEAIARITTPDAAESAERLRNSLSRILCRDGDTTHVIRPADVLFLKADQGYTLVCTESKEYLSADALAFLEQCLGDDFVRIHRSTLVNTRHVESLKHVDGDLTIVLRNAQELPVSRRHAPRLREKLLYGSG
jgi:DNA-binding LytR/AlgR family response regulator